MENIFRSDWFSSLATGWAGGTWQQLALLWLVGAICGWLGPLVLPKPKPGHTTGSVFSSFLSNTTAWKRALLAWHGAIMVRDVWYYWTCPGTARRLLRAAACWVSGGGWKFDFPSQGSEAGSVLPGSQASATHTEGISDSWYVTERDLAFFDRSLDETTPEGSAGGLHGPWETLMSHEIPGVIKYTAWRRSMANGKTEYKSLTHSPDVTSEEYIDMLLDDDSRPEWDQMIIDHEVLEYGDHAQRQLVMRWTRRFPFSFISDREYIIAKQLFRRGQDLFGVTKSVEHPRAPTNGEVVRVDNFYSMWRSRTVPCPWGSGRPACETMLLHHEQMKIPENLARFAVRHGMWGFVRKLSSETPKFIEARRQRCSPHERDPAAYGAGNKPNPPVAPASIGLGRLLPTGSPAAAKSTAKGPGLRRITTAAGLSTMTTCASLESPEAEGEGELSRRSSTGGALPRTRSGRLRGLAAFAVASSLALLLRRPASLTSFSSTDRLPAVAAGRLRRMARSGSLRGGMRRVRTSSAFMDVDYSVSEVEGL